VPICGDSAIQSPEQCDDGDSSWAIGQPCNADCLLLLCGDADDTGDTKASDSLIALRAAVGAVTCHPCLCDVDSSGNVTATDALALLRLAVGLSASLACPSCPTG
jgi:cysteine-rich repeat protein